MIIILKHLKSKKAGRDDIDCNIDVFNVYYTNIAQQNHNYRFDHSGYFVNA